MILYHFTTPEAAAQIVETGSFLSKEAGEPVYFSTRTDGQATGYGDVAVKVSVPDELAVLEDEFPDGEQHFVVPAADLRAEHVMGIVE